MPIGLYPQGVFLAVWDQPPDLSESTDVRTIVALASWLEEGPSSPRLMGHTAPNVRAGLATQDPGRQKRVDQVADSPR